MTDTFIKQDTSRGLIENTVPSVSVLDTLAVIADIILPTLAKGIIMRRPFVMRVAERFQFDRRAIRRMQTIRAEYGAGPLLLRIPGRDLALILDPQQVRRVLENSPYPFATATKEKRAALAHFEPKTALISTGPERQERRRYNETVLESDRKIHDQAAAFLWIIHAEAERLCWSARKVGELNWTLFSEAWFRVVRRVVFGDAASDDDLLSSMMAKLRRSANWAFLAPQRHTLRRELLRRIQGYLERAEPGSLAGAMSQVHATALTAPEQQVTQWLFAFDAAGMTTYRSLGLLASHPDYAREVRAEISTNSGQLTLTRRVVSESLRLWPTTPLILRETTRTTEWETGTLRANTELIIFTPFFHRDDERLSYADRFTPELWDDSDRARDSYPIIPFSDGPATCPGRNLVMFLTSSTIAAILSHTRLSLKRPTPLIPALPLPATLNHFTLRFGVAEIPSQSSVDSFALAQRRS
ncbi:MAG: cytochrome P450 [Acidobacteriaceae bacterium]|nr:cytochrome P450 [Acidobacteriaceae bacterium]